MDWRRFLPDAFTQALLATVLLASLLPCRGAWAQGFEWLTDLAIGVLFFLHGAKLSRAAVAAGLFHWRLQGCILISTFLLFPLLGWLAGPIARALVGPELYLGLLFLCALPSTVQSSIAFVSLARGNVSAAICAASASSLLGIVITPLWVEMLLGAEGSGMSWSSLGAIVVQLLLPFAAGQLAQPWIGGWIGRHGKTLKYVDQSSILLVVYTAFSGAVLQGLWHQATPAVLALVVVLDLVLLAVVLSVTRYGGRWLGFALDDQITLIFCGSKKSLASGVAMAKVLFAGHPLGLLVLPLMLFHQLQLMVCAMLAQRYARRMDDGVVRR